VKSNVPIENTSNLQSGFNRIFQKIIGESKYHQKTKRTQNWNPEKIEKYKRCGTWSEAIRKGNRSFAWIYVEREEKKRV